MGVLQTLIATASRRGSGSGSSGVLSTDWFGQQWLYVGRDNTPTLAPTGTYTVYTQSTNINNVTFGDGTTGDVANFNNSSWTSADLNAYGYMTTTTSIAIDMWIYPTANGVQVLSEWGQAVNPGWHASVLEINTDNTVSARLWAGSSLTSTDTVTLNAWNHLYLVYDSTVTTMSLRVNNGTAVVSATSYPRQSNYVSGGNVYFNIGEYDITNINNTGRFAGDLGEIRINNWAAPSSYWSGAKKYLNLGGTVVTDSNLKINLQGTTAPSGSYWNDSTANGNNAIMNGSYSWNAGTGYYSIAGSGNYGEITNDGSTFGTANTTPAQTMSMWINVESQNVAYQSIAGLRQNSNYDFYFLLLYTAGNPTEFRTHTFGGYGDNLVSYYPLFGKWTHVTCVADGTQSRLYFNSKLVGTVSIAGTFGTGGGVPFYLNDPGFSSGSTIDYAEVQFYNRVLTTAEIEQNYATNKLRLGL